MSDTIGPDGLTDEKRAAEDGYWAGDSAQMHSSAGGRCCDDPGRHDRRAPAQHAAAWLAGYDAGYAGQSIGVVIATLAAERLAHAETRAERDRLRAALAEITWRWPGVVSPNEIPVKIPRTP